MANSSSYGVMTTGDMQPGYLNNAGATAVWDTTNESLLAFSAAVQRSFAPLIEETTTDYTRRYLTSDGGEMQEVDSTNDMGLTGEVKGGSGWDISLPMTGFRDALGGSERSINQLSEADFQNRVQTVKNRYLNTYRRGVLRSLFRNTVFPYKDPKWGTLNVQPLANNDGTLYANADGSAPANRNNYYGAAADWTTIDGNKNPFPTIVTRLRLLHGFETANTPIVIFINSAQEAGVEALANFVEVPELNITPGANTATFSGYRVDLPGRPIGKCNGAQINVWDQIPAGYVFGFHTGAKPPLIRRVDPPALRTSPNLVLTNPQGDPNFPFLTWRFEAWFGIGAGNRPNGVAYDLTGTTPGTYVIPTGLV